MIKGFCLCGLEIGTPEFYIKHPEARTRKKFITRMDGRIEWICEHDIGHTIFVPKQNKSDSSWWSHGCDGCCKIFKTPHIRDGDIK